MTYCERDLSVSGVVLWEKDIGPSPIDGRILPDGCMDLIWDGARLLIAEPDTKARRHTSSPNVSYAALRFSRGLGPGFLGVPANEVRDLYVEAECIWASAQARELSEQMAAGGAQALERWLMSRAGRRELPQLGAAVFHLAAGGASVTAMAERLGRSVRQLHRRSLPLFGYGPQHLSRVLRFGRALAAARSGLSLAQVATTVGFADQAHLSREMRDLAGTSPSRLLQELAS